ncbi:Avidin family, partial [Pristimantis euphronides]
MKQISMLVVLLSCFVIHAAAQPSPCNLKGRWKNELGSTMSISATSNEGHFSGTYLTSVTASNNTILESSITGYQQRNDSSIFGFTVNWAFTNSITVFTGQCFISVSGRRFLQTTWLLRTESNNIKDNWMQTR